MLLRFNRDEQTFAINDININHVAEEIKNSGNIAVHLKITDTINESIEEILKYDRIFLVEILSEIEENSIIASFDQAFKISSIYDIIRSADENRLITLFLREI